MSSGHLTTTLSLQERKLARTKQTYYSCCQSRQNICKFVLNVNKLLGYCIPTTVANTYDLTTLPTW